MTQSPPDLQPSLGLIKGEWVVVRSEQEILATLDEYGRFDGLPFMPEMLAYCGQRIRVGRTAHKTCDTIKTYTNRRMHNAVHLEGIDCNGSGHDGCGARCPIFWKEAWLERDTKSHRSLLTRLRSMVLQERRRTTDQAPGCRKVDLEAHARKLDADGSITYTCQATELRAATVPLGKLDWRQYVQDLASGNVSLGFMLKAAFFASLRKTFALGPGYRLKRRAYRALQHLLGGPPIADEFGTLDKTPTAQLDLKPGERVRVKPYSEIVKTLSKSQRNRGMWFDNEMLPYCGQSFDVLSRVDRLVDEKTGKMLPMKNDCIILENVICRAACSDRRLFCPRQLYPFWREIWLERAD